MERSPNLVLMGVAVMISAATLAACGGARGLETKLSVDRAPPVVIEEVDATGLSRLTLSESAAERLDIQTSVVESSGDQLVVPSAAVIIDTEGVYWVYTNPEPLVFLRQEIGPVYEEEHLAYFAVGPSLGTSVVITGVPELYGAEFGIGN